ncbi:MAG: UDP-glucose 4-epimerase GalE [Betaproteobacteria bacterium]|nr:UDP-glucose 4-epimerase GalE [Betaproteobacteria bacterium]
MILVTGGTGYIGSHTCVALAHSGRDIVILDNLSNSRVSVVDRLEKLCGKRPQFIHGDVRDAALLGRIFADYPIQAVIHFAGLKAVGESVAKPLEYYDNNVRGTLELLAAMRRANVRTLVFSSSATVYGDPASVPIREDFPRSATNPYGRSKLIVEDILADLCHAEPDWRVARLRYFNPIGAHESGLIGEDPQGTPNNLMPYIAQVAAGQREFLNVFGNDYPTPDGTGVRDYIHVADLADGHIAALKYLNEKGALLTINLGTGQGYSVLEMIAAFERASGRSVPYRIVPRRPRDIARCWADPTLASQLLDWKAARGLDAMCADACRWQLANEKA